MSPSLLMELACVFHVEADSYRDPTHVDDAGGLRPTPRAVDYAEADRLDAIARALGRRAYCDEGDECVGFDS